MFRSRRGSYLVEASLIYPVIVFVTVLVIAVSVYVWINVSNAADMEMAMRRLAGEEAGTVIYSGSFSGLSGDDVSDGNAGGLAVGAGSVNSYNADGGPQYVVCDYPIPNYYIGDYNAGMQRSFIVKKFSASGNFSYENDTMFNVFSRNDYALHHSVVSEVDIIWNKQLVSDLMPDY